MAIKNTQETVVDPSGNETIIYRQTTAANVLVSEDSTENARAHLQYYAVCATEANAEAKVISVAGGTSNVLAASVLFTIKFTNGNTVEAPTINVNGQGAKSIIGSNLNKIKADQVVQFTYNGTSFVLDDTIISASEETSTTTLYPVMVSDAGAIEDTKYDSNLKYSKGTGLETDVSNSTVAWKDDADENTDPVDNRSLIEQSGKTSGLFKNIKKVLKGLGTAAFTNSSDYATAEQGTKADNALTTANLFDGVTQETAGVNALDAHAGLTLQNQIDTLSSKVADLNAGDGNMTTGEMIKEIYDSTAGKYTKTAAVQNIGTVSGASSTIGVTKFAPQYYSQLTKNNFFVVISSVSNGTTINGGQGVFRGRYSGFNISTSYDASTGILTVKGLTSSVHLWGGNGEYSVESKTINISATVYLVIPND